MVVLLEQYWWVLVIALLLGVVIAWVVFASGRKTHVETSITPDVLDEGSEPARRNQALIDAPPAAFKADIPAPAASPVTPPTAPVAAPSAQSVPSPAAAVEPAAVAAAAPAAPVVANDASAPTQTAPSAPEETVADTAAALPPSASETGDDLTKIKGLGPKIAQIMQPLGVTRYAQIAAWNDADIDRIDAQLGKFQGRIRRDNWVEQARLLANGDASGFEDRFGKV